ncbi:MAG TPA: sigma 54-interacting transcriptional regulator [Planctomycetaceae bacterium]|jgi:transcriptional regulator with GAF, ATPase, and Fis domain
MDLQKRTELTRWLLTIVGVAVVLYCLAVLGFVATSPDLGLRCLLVSGPNSTGGVPTPGLEIRQITREAAAGIREWQSELGDGPRAGDRLLEIAHRPAYTFAHFAARLLDLRTEQPFGAKPRDDTPIREQGKLLPPMFPKGNDVFVEVRFLRDGHEMRSWLPLRTVPWQDITLTLVWFLLEFGILAVGALAFWTRPFDQQARVFFAMCLVSLGGFVGGYHWWMIAGSLWLTVPFMMCAILVPVVTLHFFLVYPEPKLFFARHPYRSLWAIYGIPVLAMVALVGLAVHSIWIADQVSSDGHQERILSMLNEGISIYLGIAATYFVATLVALAASFFTTRNAVLHNQVKWILWASVFAMLPVGYSLSLAYFEEGKFSLGAASVPMFVASFLFMLAYAIGIVRYKLMLVDEILSRGMVYYMLNLAVTVGFSLAIAGASLAAMYQHNQVARHAAVVVVLVVVAVLLLNWSRDRVQRLIDRKFFREKFQLDRALQRMNQAAGSMGDPNALAQRMLASCRDLLGVDRAALYLRDASAGVFRLIAADGMPHAPFAISSDAELLGLMHEDGNVQRFESEAEQTQSQQLLHELDVELVHALEVDGQLAGALFLGTKHNGDRYTAEDLALLTTLGQITSVALQSARVHQAAARLNVDLQLKVEKISEQQQLISMLQAEITSRQQVASPAEPAPAFRRDFIKGNSPAIASVLETVRKVSGSQSSVLIRGESGTGKELLAAALHDNSPRRNGPLVSVHCGALSAGLLESELFGHVKGSFTGAHRDKLGRFEMANGGTLFLDEIGDISLDTQIKLLRVLQEREFEPVGGTRSVQVDVRLIAATHQNLEKLIVEGRFREDLFYRLNVISITLPPLRDRADDIIELALYFLNRAAERAGKRITHLDEPVIEALKRYPWPGNIRELENAIERSVVMAEEQEIRLLDLPAVIVTAASRNVRVIETKPSRLDSTASRPLEELALPQTTGGKLSSGEIPQEKLALVDALTRSGGNKAEAARLLGIPRSTLFSRLKKYGFE